MRNTIFMWMVLLSSIGICCAFEPISLTTGAIAAAIWGVVYDKSPCRLYECCDSYSVSTDGKNLTALQEVLKKNVYGQHLVHDIVIRALTGHMQSSHPSKALVFSFHGSPGCGKSYVSEFIAQSLFVKGMKSRFVRKFVAGSDFPDPSMAAVYRLRISDEIRSIVRSCERSLFIFDDVHKMPAHILDGIVPFIDHHSNVEGTDFRKSIFIFISNTGAGLINQKSLELWSSGTQREDIIKLSDFESLIKQGAFNEAGGFHKSDTISTNLIDHYIPFLPLEEKHVRRCIDDEFKKCGVSTPAGAPEQILEEMTFMPESTLLYSTSGCKRVAGKVSAWYYGGRFRN